MDLLSKIKTAIQLLNLYYADFKVVTMGGDILITIDDYGDYNDWFHFRMIKSSKLFTEDGEQLFNLELTVVPTRIIGGSTELPLDNAQELHQQWGEMINICKIINKLHIHGKAQDIADSIKTIQSYIN